MVISKDFREFIESLNARKVRYLIVGGYAVALHGHPRYTKDMDVWVSPDPANIRRLLDSLKDFGFHSVGLTEKDFSDPDAVIQLGYPPNRIDLLTELKDVNFDTCWKRKETCMIEKIPVHFIDLASLKATKAATGRHQDLADVENLK
jgi:hypothetical protein